MSEGGSPSEAERSKCPIIRSWLDIPDVAARAALGKLADVGKDGLTRECVSANADILEPLIQEFGTRPSINQVMDVVGRFLFLCRPRGRKLPCSSAIKTEAWILRRLVSLFGQVTRRPHVPRDPRLRQLFKIVGIDFESESGTNGASQADAGDEPTDWDESAESELETDDECLHPENAKECDGVDGHRPEGILKTSAASDAGSDRSSSLGTTLVLTPQPRKRSESVPTGPKPCDPVKCGWLCVTCKRTCDRKDVMLSHKCVREEGHVLVESPLVCKKCFQLGYDFSSFKSHPCPKELTFDDKPTPVVSTTNSADDPEIPDERWVTRVDHERKTRVQADMQAAQKEIKRLELLKKLQLERQQLANLMAQKRTATSPDMLDTFPMSEYESSRLAAIEAMKSSPPSHVSEETPKPLTRTVNKDSLVTQGAAKEEPKEKSSVEAASTEHAETLPVTAPPAGISKKAMAKALEAVKTTPCLSPEEQCKALGKTPKPKGRPRNKHAKANATPKAKSTAKDKTKTTRKAKTGDRKRKAGKTTETNGNEGMEEEYAWDEEYEYEEAQEPMDWEEDDTGYDEENGDHSHDTLPPASKTRKPRGKGKTGKAAPSSSSSKAKAPKASSSSSKAKAPKAKAKASSKKDKKVATQETTTDPDTLAKKARLSRKSCASKKARREALNAGKTPEEAKAAAAKACRM